MKGIAVEKGYLNFMLHAHLPFVRHPEYRDSFEEKWLYEAITETYIPLILIFHELIERKIELKITMSVTPPLMEMLSDELLQQRYIAHIEKLIELMEKEKIRTRGDTDFYPLALMYERKFRKAREIFVDRYGRNLLTAFRELQSGGYVEVVTCCATHGFLPLMDFCREAVRAQIFVAAQNYRKHMGTSPRGIWLAECGYNPGDDQILKEAGIRFFFVDSHGLILATPRPKYALYSPVYCPSGVAVFARDPESSKQVWSSKEGYPGDFDYREFYRDVGYDLDFDYIAPYIHESGIRLNTGVKYYRITGSTDQKKPYNETAALAKTKNHARHFVSCRIQQAEYLREVMDRPPIITCPYDAELYGHWWYEGPEFLKAVYYELAATKYVIKPMTPINYIDRFPENPVATPSMSSWGHKGYAEYWLEECNDWIYRHLHKASERMTELATHYHDAQDGTLIRALKQAARELLLAQSSDWAFIIKTGTHVEYAVLRTREHILNFTVLYEAIKKNEVPLRFLSGLEEKNNIFSEIDYRIFAAREGSRTLKPLDVAAIPAGKKKTTLKAEKKTPDVKEPEQETENAAEKESPPKKEPEDAAREEREAKAEKDGVGIPESPQLEKETQPEKAIPGKKKKSLKKTAAEEKAPPPGGSAERAEGKEAAPDRDREKAGKKEAAPDRDSEKEETKRETSVSAVEKVEVKAEPAEKTREKTENKPPALSETIPETGKAGHAESEGDAIPVEESGKIPEPDDQDIHPAMRALQQAIQDTLAGEEESLKKTESEKKE